MKGRFFLLTWLYSVLFNIVFSAIMLFVQVILKTHYMPIGYELRSAMEDVYLVALFSIPFSVPGLLALLLATHLSDFFLNTRQRFAFVIVFSLVGTLTGYFLMWVLIGINPFYELTFFIPVSLVAVLLALLIKRNHFYKAFTLN